jgi:hypothetical protein
MKYLDQYNKIKDLKPRKRGFEFEKLFNKICEDQGILLSNSYKTADSEQQIDGAVEINSRIFLIESKWEKKATLAASKLFSFLGKINSKIEGTIGIFISYNELSENFISAVRNGLRQTCIVIHGEENIMDIIEEKVNLKDFIWYTFQQASTKNRSFVNTSEYQSLPKKQIKQVSIQIDTKWNEISSYLLDSSSVDKFATCLETNYHKDIELSKKALNLFSVVYTNALRQQKYLTLIKKCLIEEKDSFKTQIIQRLRSKRWTEFVKYSFLDNLKGEFDSIESADKNKIIENAINHLEEYLGSYDDENNSSELIDFLFEYLSVSDFEKLSNAYLVIYCDSSRKDKFLQKKISDRIFRKLKELEKEPFDVVKSTIITKLQDEKRDEYIFETENDDKSKIKEGTINHICRRYSKVLDKQEHKDFLRDEYDKL